MSMTMHSILDAVAGGGRLDEAQALGLAAFGDLGALMEAARGVRDRRSGEVVTYSPKIFIPLTELCRDVCRYCTFAKTPGNVRAPYLAVDEAVDIARRGAAAGCTEALFTLGDQPERRYRAAREALARMGFASTIDYLVHAARRVHEETGLLPHVNPGVMTREELARLREVSVSAGIMLESASRRLCEKGGPHFGSPDKEPAVRLATMERAGELAVPFTTGILIGIGETRCERVESLLAIRDLEDRHGHIQEVIVQNFRAKPGTPMATAPEPSLEDHQWTIAVARLVLGPGTSVQAPPNLRPGALARLVEAGLDDWGGVSPVTPDHVNPEAPWPHLIELERTTEAAGKSLAPRLPLHPRFVLDPERWVDPGLRSAVLAASDGQGLGRETRWHAGDAGRGPELALPDIGAAPVRGSPWDTDAATTVSPAKAGMTAAINMDGDSLPPTATTVIPSKAGTTVRTESARGPSTVVPPKAGMTVRPESARGPSTVVPPKAGMTVRPESARGPSSVIPAKAGIHRRSPLAHVGAPDTSIAGDVAARHVGGAGLPPGHESEREARGETLQPGSLAAIAVSPRTSPTLARVLDRAREGAPLDESQIVRLFEARGGEARAVCEAADALRRERNGDIVSYVVNRNINYTNVCYFKCRFCAFSKGRLSANLRGRPYDLDLAEIGRRTREAWDRGATEICLQGGIHPDYTGETYLSICRAVKDAAPEVHVHAFSPLEVWQGARTLGIELPEYIERLRKAGLGSLPGTAAEILDDEVRRVLCPDKITTAEWLEVMESAHRVGLGSTATIMFGHVDGYRHWARHLLRVRGLAERTGGFTEFVPLPFVHMESPMYLRGLARRGPTLREAVLMHAVGRLALDPWIANIQTSWVKMGPDGMRLALAAGANDVGGTLMNESITRAAGAGFGQEMPPERLESIIREAGRRPRQRTTRYSDAPAERCHTAFGAPALTEPVYRRARRFERGSSVGLVRSGFG